MTSASSRARSGSSDAQPVQHPPRVFEPAHLHVGLAEVLERLGKVGTQPQRLVVRVQRFRVPALVAKRVAQLVPGLGKRGAEARGRRNASAAAAQSFATGPGTRGRTRSRRRAGGGCRRCSTAGALGSARLIEGARVSADIPKAKPTTVSR